MLRKYRVTIVQTVDIYADDEDEAKTSAEDHIDIHGPDTCDVEAEPLSV